ncbi:peptidylprolyl isomerase [Limnohabitans sp. Hippo3]|uniref:peptidylprolyl isomerase n=1 Tax=Limnohabitans sp. Hippo3 TaxID=1597956 RepID=UPI000D3DABDC|nr:peptidylprolyl isomerase [Limnohabitans sp. Hippo3]PUE38796.1 molecular chaperone SurA [Limnohabitans sp. Hippo3]
MNKLFSPARSAFVASVWGVMGLLASTGAWAQTAAPAVSNRQADFIVAVVNSEPITNRDVQVLRQRLANEAARAGNRPDANELTRLALEQLINEKAQMQQAREAGIKIDTEAIDQAELNVAASNQLTREEMHKRLAQDGIALSSFREQLRTQLTLSRLREREIEGRVRVSDLEVEQFLREQLKAQAAQVPAQLNLGMILIAVPENSSEATVQALGERAADVARRARVGENFAELAKATSQAADRGANGGEMGLRPADRYPELFLDATRNLKTGEVSAPVRSAAGFHILKVLERRQANTLLVTQTRARHILLRPSAQMSQAQAVAKLTEVRQAVVSGKADFAAVARQMSQDGSAQQGGDLGWANPGMFVPEFEQVMNRLRPGQVAEPLVSRFGVHLIEVTDRRNAPMSDQEQRTMARNALREKKLDEAYAAWVEDIRGRAYVEMREPPQ